MKEVAFHLEKSTEAHSSDRWTSTWTAGVLEHAQRVGGSSVVGGDIGQ